MAALPAAYTTETAAHARQYGCVGCTSPPSAVLFPQRTENRVDVRRKLQLHCTLTGSPRPTVVWLKDDVIVTPNKHVKLRFDERRNRTHLRVSKAKVEDSGIYRCHAVNALGESFSNSTQVIVREAISNRPHAVLCERQNYCLNHGTCYMLPAIGRKFCECVEQFGGPRCQDRTYILPWRDRECRFASFESLLIPLILFMVFILLIIISILLCALLWCGPRRWSRRRCQIPKTPDPKERQPMMNVHKVTANHVVNVPDVETETQIHESRSRSKNIQHQTSQADANPQGAGNGRPDGPSRPINNNRMSLQETPAQHKLQLAKRSSSEFRTRKGGVSEDNMDGIVDENDRNCEVLEPADNAVNAPLTAASCTVKADCPEPVPAAMPCAKNGASVGIDSNTQTPSDGDQLPSMRRHNTPHRSQSDRFDCEAVKQYIDNALFHESESHRPRSDDYHCLASKIPVTNMPVGGQAQKIPMDFTNKGSIAAGKTAPDFMSFPPHFDHHDIDTVDRKLNELLYTRDDDCGLFPEKRLNGSKKPASGITPELSASAKKEPVLIPCHVYDVPNPGHRSPQPYSDGDIKSLGQSKMPISYSDLCRPRLMSDVSRSPARQPTNCLLPDRRLSDYDIDRSLAASDLEVNMESEADVQALNASEEDVCAEVDRPPGGLYLRRSCRDESSFDSSDSDSSVSSNERSVFSRPRPRRHPDKKSMAESSADDERQCDVDWDQLLHPSFRPDHGMIGPGATFSLNRNDILYAQRYLDQRAKQTDEGPSRWIDDAANPRDGEDVSELLMPGRYPYDPDPEATVV